MTSCHHGGVEADRSLRHAKQQGFGLLRELGDNVYADTFDSCSQQRVCASERLDAAYMDVVAPEDGSQGIPVMATWDDHDFCANNMGDNCDKAFLAESQKNFLAHFGPPKADPRWNGRRGVDSAKRFGAGKDKDVHVIMLDARSGRSPTHSAHGACKGAGSSIMDEAQWAWLEGELAKEAAVTVIGSGIQVLMPLAATSGSASVNKTSYCAYDANDNTFDAARRALGELGANETDWCPDHHVSGGHVGCTARGTNYESWAEMPQARLRLLRMVQRSLWRGMTKAVVFVSGDQHWAEISAKTLPAFEEGGDVVPAQTVHELTSSGMAASHDRSTPFYNDNRAPAERCDSERDSVFANQCAFPFKHNGVEYTSCTMVGQAFPWCYYQVNSQGEGMSGRWGQCASFVNVAPSNYGEVQVDVDAKQAKLVIWATTTGVSGPRVAMAEEYSIPLLGEERCMGTKRVKRVRRVRPVGVGDTCNGPA